jgi:hypothetical protein
MKKNFWENEVNYKRVAFNSKTIVTSYLDTFKKQQWGKFASFNHTGSLPYPYVLRKQKDLSRSRPVVSYANHPLKKVIQVASSALLLCVKALPEEYRSANIFSTKDMLPNLLQKYEMVKNIFGENTEYFTYAGDIKEMYTHLPQNVIIEAIKWVLCIIQTKSRRMEVSVNFQDSKRNRLGKSYSFVCITFSQIFAVCLCDITRCFFVLSSTVFKQIFGIPIGSPGSPAYSMIICIFYEWKFLQSIYDYQKVFGMSRYLDDLRALVVYEKGNPTSEYNAMKIINLLADNCYHEAMVLIPEKSSNNSFQFLESRISISLKTITAYLHNKNFQDLLQEGRPMILSSQHFHSFTGETPGRQHVRMGTIFGRLAAAEIYSYPQESLVISFIHLYIQFRALKYPPEMIIHACMKKFHTTKRIIWKLLASLVKIVENTEAKIHFN